MDAWYQVRYYPLYKIILKSLKFSPTAITAAQNIQQRFLWSQTRKGFCGMQALGFEIFSMQAFDISNSIRYAGF